MDETREFEKQRAGASRSDEAVPVSPSQDPGSPWVGRVFQVSPLSLVYRYAFLLLLTAVGAFVLYLLVPMGIRARDWIVLALIGFWTLALLRYWAFLLSMPFRIQCEEDGFLKIKSLFRTTRISSGEIAALKVSAIYPGYLKIITSRKKSLLLLNHIDGLHELIHRIKAANPGATTRGC